MLIHQILRIFPKFYWHTSLVICCLLLFLASCKQLPKNKSHREVPDSSIEKGRILAASHCQGCHLLPDPSLLDAKTWETGVLPAMGPRLGIFYYGFQKYPSSRYDKNLPLNYYPAKNVVSFLEWQNIIDYYTSLAPDTLPAQQRSKLIKTGLSVFKVETATDPYPSPAICLTKIDTVNATHQLLLFDLLEKNLYRYNDQLLMTDKVNSGGAITDIDIYDSTMLACNIEVINPNNAKFGKAQLIKKGAGDKLGVDHLALFDSLTRPVQILSCDLNNDKKIDYLVCEFGNLTGALSWRENMGNGKYLPHVLRSEPGAVKAIVEDVNHDGLQDIWALFSQGDEGIFLFSNKGNGRFEVAPILRFPPVYGSTYFEFADFNNDGREDIVYTCGDNADYSITLKPYHGIYIFLNQGNNHFKQQYFFPMNGCYKAMAGDYDRDGDLDIAAIAFFADFATQPDEGFIYLQNNGRFIFEPFTIPEGRAGRWLTMDAGDLDGDGKIDLVLGNFSIRPSDVKPVADWKKGPPFLYLKNISQR